MQTTKKDFSIFVERCKYWIKVFGLTEWEINFRHESGGKTMSDSFSWIITDNEGNQFTIISLNTERERTPSAENLKEDARHEVLHLLLADLCNAGEERYVSRDQLHKAEHMVIRRLEKVL